MPAWQPVRCSDWLSTVSLPACRPRSLPADAETSPAMQAQEAGRDAATLRKAVSQGFRDTDKLCLEACKAQKLHAGATCVAAWVLDSTLIVANIGV